jgi:hypothetical protein
VRRPRTAGKAASVVQLNGEGPFDITYINPADDPQKAAKP